MKVLGWSGLGDEPPRASNVKQLLWDSVQEYQQDTGNRHDPRLKDIPATMGAWSRRDRREVFNASKRDAVLEVDEDCFDPGWDAEDLLLSMLDDNALGEYMGPECFPTRKAELLAKNKATNPPRSPTRTTFGNPSLEKPSRRKRR